MQSNTQWFLFFLLLQVIFHLLNRFFSFLCNLLSLNLSCSCRSASCTQEVPLQGKVTSLDISPNHRDLLSCSRDESLQLVDLRMSNARMAFRCGELYSRAVPVHATLTLAILTLSLSQIMQYRVCRSLNVLKFSN